MRHLYGVVLIKIIILIIFLLTIYYSLCGAFKYAMGAIKRKLVPEEQSLNSLREQFPMFYACSCCLLQVQF